MPASHKDSAALAAALGAVLCYGVTPVFLRHFIHDLDAWTVNGVRYTIGALFWLPFVVALLRDKESDSQARPRRGVWRDALIPSVINLFAQASWAITPYYLEAGVIGFVYKLHFLFTIVFGFILIREERPVVRDPWFIAGALVCFGGVAAMFLQNVRLQGAQSAIGMTILIGSTILFGAYAVMVRRCMAGYPARLSFGVISLYTASGLLALMFVLGDYTALRNVELPMLALVGISAITGIAFAHVLYYRAIQGMGAIVSTGLLMATPFVTLFGATLFLSERLSVLQAIGGLLVVIGGVMLVVAQSRVRGVSL
jgi:drug/metabolite transporter (DMT)-like permease